MESYRKHFEEYTLSDSEFKNAAVLFSVIICLIGFGGKAFVKEEKRLSWVITMFNSGLMTIAGVIYAVMRTHSHHWNALTFAPNGRNAFHSIDNVSALICLWFGLANIADIAFGVTFYRKQLEFLTTYVHHPVFIWIMFAATTGNALYDNVDLFASFFGMMTLEELPTFLLALGTVFPSCRTDIGFGVTFFLFRIVYHIYFAVAAFYAGVSILCRVLLVLTLTLHVFWFSSWVRSYGKYKAKAAAKAKAAVSTGDSTAEVQGNKQKHN